MNASTDPYSALAARESAVPGMALLFDVSRLTRALEHHSGATIDSIQPIYLRYKRGTNCLVAYTVSGSMGTTLVYAKALPPGSRHKLVKQMARETVPTWLGAEPLSLPAVAVTVWAHPNDAKLKPLRFLADDGGLAILLRRAPSAANGSSPLLRPLSYKPERRFVAAVSRDGNHVPAAVLRMYTPAGYQQALARAKCVTSREVLSIPARIGRDRRRRLLFFEWQSGRSAMELVRSKEPLNGRLALAGRALAHVHSQPPAPQAPVSPAYDSGVLRDVIAEVQGLFPVLAGRLTRLRSSLASADETSRSPLTPIHGDLHLRQVLLSPSSVSVVDFDRSGVGPGVGDLAFCRANLERDVLVGAVTRERLEATVEELLTGYGSVRQRPLPPLLDLYTAAALTRLLPEPFRLFLPRPLELTERLVERALVLLQSTRERTAVS